MDFFRILHHDTSMHAKSPGTFSVESTVDRTAAIEIDRSHRSRILRCLALFLSIMLGACSTSGRYENVVYTSLRIGISPDYPPIAFKKDLTLRGMEVDFAQEVGKELGKKLQIVELKWDELIPALQAGKIDVIMSGMSITPERETLVSFTLPYLEVGQMILIRRNDATRFYSLHALDRLGVIVGVENSTTGAEFAAEEITHADVRGFSNVETAIEVLREGEIDAFIHDAPTIWRYGFDPSQREFLGLYTPLTREFLAWAVRKDDASLKGQLDATIVGMKRDGRLDRICNHWIPVRVESQ